MVITTTQCYERQSSGNHTLSDLLSRWTLQSVWHWSSSQELWNYIKPHTPYILTAPSRDDQSKEGKTMWVNQHLTGFKSIIFKFAKYKSDLSKPGRILIDDRADTIERWNNNGGIGILHTSANNTSIGFCTLTSPVGWLVR